MISSLLSAGIARAGALLAGAWGKIVFLGGIALALCGVYASIRRSGRDAERTDALEKGLVTIGKANQAAKAVDHSQQAIDHDPNNLDCVR